MTIGVVLYTTVSATARPTTSLASGGNPRALAPLALIGHDVIDGVVDRQLRLPAGQLVDRRRVRLAATELLEALVIGVFVWHEADLGTGAGVLDDPAGQLDDRDLRGGADVEDAADRAGALHQSQDPADGVVDVGEAARLAAVAVDRERPTFERLADERRNDHPVAAGLP